MTMIENRVESPCIGQCCLDNENVCMGCYRLLDEIKIWAQSNNEQRIRILENTQLRRQQKVDDVTEIN